MLGSAVVELSKESSGGEPEVTWVIGCCPTRTSGLPSPPTAFTDTAVTPYPCVYVSERIDEGCVRDVAFGDLARPEHHLDIVAGRRVRVAIHGDRRIRLIAAAAVDLREGVGQLGRVLDADVLQRAQVGFEVAERRRMGRAEGPALHLRIRSGALDRPRVAARRQVVGDGRRLRRLLVRPDAGRLVDGGGHALNQPGNEEPAAEHRGRRDRRSRLTPGASADHKDHGRDRQDECEDLQEPEHRLDHRALRRVQADVRRAVGPVPVPWLLVARW